MLSYIMNFDDQFYISGGHTPRKQLLFHGVVYDGHVNGSIETIWEGGGGGTDVAFVIFSARDSFVL